MLRDFTGNIADSAAVPPDCDRRQLDTSFNQITVSTSAREILDLSTGYSLKLLDDLNCIRARRNNVNNIGMLGSWARGADTA